MRVDVVVVPFAVGVGPVCTPTEILKETVLSLVTMLQNNGPSEFSPR